MKKIRYLFFCFLILLIFLKPVFGLGGLQKQKYVTLKVGEEKDLEILLWSNKEEELELNSISSEGLEVKIPNKLIKLNPLIGDEVVFSGNSYYNASLVKISVRAKSEGLYRLFLIASTKPTIEGVATRKEIVFNFILNATSLDLEGKTTLMKNFEEKKFKGNVVLILIVIFIVVLSYVIYKKV